ncbi:MAG: helix-turn-helix transcriptional regulator [Actinobacteria bacterium]|nr:helix-turn-helix transcriptional regulator [Actinomycetota bacterium]
MMLKKHPSFHHKEVLDKICNPLAHLDISTFSHLRVSEHNKLSVLCNHPRSLKNYIDKKYYKVDPCVNLPIEQSPLGEYVVWDNVRCKGKTAEMLADSTCLGYRHVFTIIKREPQCVDYYHFGTHLIEPSLHELYINNLELLHQFIMYFNAQVKKSPSLINAYHLTLNEDQKAPTLAIGKLISSKKLQEKHRNYLQAIFCNEPSLSFTPKDIECAKLIIQGKTAKEMASYLKLSHRSIEGRVERLKEKLNCNNRSALVSKLLDVLPLYRI